jgi:hypothetical protein
MRLERELSERARLRTLLAAADTVVALRRLDVRTLKAQIAVRARRPKRMTRPQ